MQATATDLIDPRQLMKELTVEELNQKAEQYFASRPAWDFQMAKPLAGITDTPALLIAFAHVFQGLDLVPGMTVLDFGAGSCWATRWLTQLGLRAIALDVSPTALKIGRKLYTRLPIIGNRPAPKFLLSDGHRIDLPDASVDRIMCLDAFHHIANPDEVLAEMARILKPAGIAGFSEPGPHHSGQPQSQLEMRRFRVLENDIDAREIWFTAHKVGFARMQLAVFSVEAFLLPLVEFEDFLNLGSASQRFAQFARNQMVERRLFFLHKTGVPPVLDSRRRTGLIARLSVVPATTKIREGTFFIAQVTVTNISRCLWLPAEVPVGAVKLGCHLLDDSARTLELDYFRQPLTPGKGRAINPGETITLRIRMPAPARGRYILEFDLVSEEVCWFAANGSRTVKLGIEVM